LVRLQEPYFLYLTKRKWLEFFGKEIDEGKTIEQKEKVIKDRNKRKELETNTLNFYLS